MTSPRPLSMSPACTRGAPSRSSLLTRPRIQCAAGRLSATTLKLESSKCQDRHLRRSSPTSAATNLRPPASHQRLPLLLPVPPRAIGFDLLGGAGGRDSNGEDDFEGGRGSSSSSQQSSPRELLVAAGRLVLHREILAAENSSSSSAEGSPAAAALALLRAVASPGGRNDGAASSAGAALAAALVSRPSGSRGGWKGFLLDEIVVGRNNPLARSVARGGAWGGEGGAGGGAGGGGEGGGDGGGGGEEEEAAAAASAAGAALAADLAALQSLAFGGAAAASWVRGADPSAPRAWLDAFAAAVDGGGGEEEKPARQQKEEEGGGGGGGGGGESAASGAPSPRLLPPLTRGQRAAAARALSSRARWADGAPELIALWSRHGAGNVGSYFAFEWNPSSPSLIVPAAEDRGGGTTAAGSSKLLAGGGGAAAALWDPVAQRLAAWARGDRLAPFDAGCFAARLEVPPSSLAERGRGRVDESGDGDDDEKKKKKEKKKEQGGSFSSSSSASPCPSLSLWDGLRTSPVLLASGARLVRLPAVSSSSSSSSQTLPLRSLWRALRLHPRARWVVVSDSFPAGGGGGEAALAMEGELPPGVALAVRKR